MSPLRAALLYTLRPSRTLRELTASGRALHFAIGVALVVSTLAGVRAGLGTGGSFHAVRFASSLSGFFVLGAIATFVGRAFGGSGRFAAVTAAFAGSALPFVIVDALWIAATGAAGAVATALTAIERASWLGALVLLVVGLSEAHAFSLARAALTVSAIAAGAAAIVFGVRALR